MLPPANRLISKFDFERVKRLGESFPTPFWVMAATPRKKSPTEAGPRFGFVASAHLDKRATKRNRAKRVLREAVRLWLKSHPDIAISHNLDVVFILRKKILTANYGEISSLVNTFLPKIFKF